MGEAPSSLQPRASLEQGIDLKRQLLVHVSFYALIIGLLSSIFVLYGARTRVQSHISSAGHTVMRLIAGEAVQPRGSFARGLDGLSLASLDEFGPLLSLCVSVEDIYKHAIVARCFGDAPPAPRLIRWLLGRLIGPDMHFIGDIGQYPGFKVGEFTVTPNLDSEAAAIRHQLSTVLGMTFGILFLNLLIYLPVRRALQPSEQILETLERMEAGDLTARMPRPRLVELRRIGAGFDHLVERLQKSMAEHRRLSQRLLAVREEERRHLARELHDEFGQCLASVGAEAAFISERAGMGCPQLLPAAQAIRSVTAHMMEALQGILTQLRPVGLDAFGLSASIEQLINGWRRRNPNCTFALTLEGDLDHLPEDLTISLYRITQESLTNALRHASPSAISVTLVRGPTQCSLRVDDDGQEREPGTVGSGLGVLGMRERVTALGGHFSMVALPARGMRVSAEFPAESMKAPSHEPI
jgi:protein-histidine pros-kinase